MDIAEVLADGLEQRKRELVTVGKVSRYMRGEHARSYMPKTHEREFDPLTQKAVGNWLPLVVDAIAQTLYVEGYQRDSDPDNVAAWEHWTANGLESRQSLVHRSALTYGKAFVVVLPGEPSPVIRAYSPLVMTTLAEDPDSEFPDYAIRRVRKHRFPDGSAGTLWEVLDSEGVWQFAVPNGETDAQNFELLEVESHGFDVCPVVEFRNRWQDDPEIPFAESGEVWPLIPIQDRLNDTTLGLLIAQQYSAFRQKWATGIEIPRDPETGKPVETFQAAVHRLWTTASKDAKFGEFSETDLSGYLASLDSAIKHMSAIAQVPPHYLLGGLVNISAEALAAAEAGLTRKAGERKTILGESWGRVLRLAAYAAGDLAGAADTNARVVWRDTEARSLAAAADGLGKLASMLQVPAEALWELIPGVTPFQIRQWKKMAADSAADSAAAIAAALLEGNDRSWRVGTPSGSAVPESSSPESSSPEVS